MSFELLGLASRACIAQLISRVNRGEIMGLSSGHALLPPRFQRRRADRRASVCHAVWCDGYLITRMVSGRLSEYLSEWDESGASGGERFTQSGDLAPNASV